MKQKFMLLSYACSILLVSGISLTTCVAKLTTWQLALLQKRMTMQLRFLSLGADALLLADGEEINE